MLTVIKQEMDILEVNYEPMEWTSKTIPSDGYWVGEWTEVPTLTEDGKEEYTFILTGTTRGEWSDLEADKDRIKEHFPSVGGFRCQKDNGDVIIVFFNGSFPVPTGEMGLKRMQINLDVMVWKGMN
ncbi:MAG: hypothetical protein J6Q39_08320 [Bacteroidales bacterium]|nr:hypothetical protein [Bacteroidales bacterium]